MSQAAKQSNSNVVPITSARSFSKPHYEPPPPMQEARQSVEMALLLAVLSALSIGNSRDRAMFALVKYELGRLGYSDPTSPEIAAATRLLDRVMEVNHGR